MAIKTEETSVLSGWRARAGQVSGWARDEEPSVEGDGLPDLVETLEGAEHVDLGD